MVRGILAVDEVLGCVSASTRVCIGKNHNMGQQYNKVRYIAVLWEQQYIKFF